jgi:anti-anti-sigma factor
MSTRRLVDGTLVVDVQGELDGASTVTLRDALFGDVIAARPSRVVVDLGAVTAMDDSALNALLWVQREVHACGASLEVTNASPSAARLLQAAGTAERVTVDS